MVCLRCMVPITLFEDNCFNQAPETGLNLAMDGWISVISVMSKDLAIEHMLLSSGLFLGNRLRWRLKLRKTKSQTFGEQIV